MKKGRPKGDRADGWGKEAVVFGLGAGQSLRKICEQYCGESTWSSLRNEVNRWRSSDPEFEAVVSAVLGQRQKHPAKSKVTALDGDWQTQFCQDYRKTASRLQAAKKAPYDYPYLYKMLTPGYPEYDERFHELVHAVELEMCAEAEGTFFQALRKADGARDSAWIAKQWLERRDPDRWGKKVELNHKGQVDHRHAHVHQLAPREQRIADLFEDQQSFFGKSGAPVDGKALPEASASIEEVVDAEIVDAEIFEATPETSATPMDQ